MTAAFLKDAAERVIASFVEAVLALVLAGGVSTVNASTVHVLLVAGLTAALATAKTIAASLKGGTVSPASLLPQAKRKTATRRQAGFTVLEVCAVIVALAAAIWIIHFFATH